ncbi:MAG TPA: WhiB family transcriptional regulator [Candidatus Saccharimonadales bacterium]|nr:WhiB family transcriptional regulator [Candidatus Saccharimonadales bacterium]
MGKKYALHGEALVLDAADVLAKQHLGEITTVDAASRAAVTACLGRRYQWTDDAQCGKKGRDLFFNSVKRLDIKQRKLCGQCPVRAQCLLDGLTTSARLIDAARGGYSIIERRELNKFIHFDRLTGDDAAIELVVAINAAADAVEQRRSAALSQESFGPDNLAA